MTPTRIEWADYVWNPVTGCLNGCEYCYARRFAYRLRGRFGYPKDDPFKPTFHPDRLDEPSKVKKPSRIFVCSMGELFGLWISDDWIHQVITVIRDNPHHIFLLLTKCPNWMRNFVFPYNGWCGTTVETRFRYNERIPHLMETNSLFHFASFEPLQGRIPRLDDWLDWIIIGAETGNRKGKITPKHEWIEDLTKQADDYNIPVFHKDNLAPYYKGTLRREYPRR